MYGDSQALYSSDDLSIFPLPSSAKQDSSPKNRELFMDSAGNQTISGLLRFRSAPSSFFESFSDGTGESLKNRGENQGLTSRFSSAEAHGDGYSVNSQLPPQYPTTRTSSTQLESVSVNGGYRMPNSTGMDHLQGQYKMGSNIMRQNSSPADLFSHLSAQSGYAKMRAVRRYRMGNGGTGTENLSPTSSMSKAEAGPMDFSSVGVHSSTLGMLSRISEIDNEIGGADDGKLNGDDDQFYGSGLPFGSWNNNPSKFDENFTALKREIDDDHSLFQGGELRNPPSMLSHHLSLPKTPAEIAAMEKLFQISDSVPCKIRAKRGCATHPRSIAERVRRTRISERMRKLQELVPNMDKQTNTAGMLDLAVDYIKDLQKQYKTLSDIRANCKCSAAMKHHPVPDQRI